jgi:diadenylate cyclase
MSCALNLLVAPFSCAFHPKQHTPDLAAGDVYPKRGAQWMFESILCEVTEYDPNVLEPLIELAVEIAREGREGRRVGTLFTLGDENAVLARSRPLILDPLLGHPVALRQVRDLNLRGTVKELAQLDGAFVVSHDGIVLSACRYLDAGAAQVEVPMGLGSRHIAAANMSAVTKAVGIVVSESSVVRLFCHGQLVSEIIPELWMMDHAVHLRGAVKREQVGELTVLTPNGREASIAK